MKKAVFKVLVTMAFSMILSITVLGQSDNDNQKPPPKEKKNPPTIPVKPKNDRPKDDKNDKPKKPPGDFAYMMFASRED